MNANSMLTTRTAFIRFAILLVSVCAIDIAVVFLTDHPLRWARWVPMLIPLLSPVIFWDVIRDSAKTEK